jgi:ribosome modulation factor
VITDLTALEETLRRLSGALRPTEEEAYRNGYSAGRDGVNDTNCHFASFATPVLRDAWERGNRDAKDGKPATP